MSATTTKGGAAPDAEPPRSEPPGRSPAPSPAASGGTKSAKLRDAAVLALSGVVLVVAAGANLSKSPAPQAPALANPNTKEAPLLPPPLPSGAAEGATAWPYEDATLGCHFAERGFGDYEAWRKLPLGRALVPRALGVSADAGFDLLIHFHGAEAIRKQLAVEPPNLVVVGVDVGLMSGAYTKAFADRAVWPALVASIEREVAKAIDRPSAHVRHLALSSWSAGYGAVAQILLQKPAKIDALILLDSLHASYGAGTSRFAPGQLAPFVEAARDASRGGPLFYMTHTEIPTEGYASTSETAAFLLGELKVDATLVTPDPESPIPLRRLLERGRLFVRGYAGATKEDHCAQLRLLPPILIEQVLPAFAADPRP